MGVGAPVEQEVEQVPSALRQGEVQGAGWLEIRVVAVAEQEEGERLIAILECDLQRRGAAPLASCDLRVGLERPPVTDPLLDVVETAVPAELVQL